MSSQCPLTIETFPFCSQISISTRGRYNKSNFSEKKRENEKSQHIRTLNQMTLDVFHVDGGNDDSNLILHNKFLLLLAQTLKCVSLTFFMLKMTKN